MGLAEELAKLREKYKQNGYRLSKSDSALVRKKIIKLLEREKMEATSQAITYVIDFPAEIGIDAYMEYYSQIDPNKRRLLNKMMVNSEKFKENKNYKSVDRGAVLVKRLIAGDYDQNNILFMLKNICYLMLKEADGEVEDKKLEEMLKIFTLSDQYKSLKHALNKEQRTKNRLKTELTEREEEISDLRSEIAKLKSEGESGKEEAKSSTRRLWKL